ncbi:hypothetical protein D3C87_759240 [compost metagenome]|jgi:hypothetical protein
MSSRRCCRLAPVRGVLSPRHAVLMLRTPSAAFGSLWCFVKGSEKWWAGVTLGCLDSGGRDHRVVVDYGGAGALRCARSGISCG